jgi:hypothetical protein
MSHVVSLDRWFRDEIVARLERDTARRTSLEIVTVSAGADA